MTNSNQDLQVLTIGYAKRMLEAGSREQERIKALSPALGRLVMVVFTRRSDNLPTEFQAGNVSMYGTNARTKIGMLWRAYWIGRKVVGAEKSAWVVSAQDPFATSVIAWLLSLRQNVALQVQLHGDFYGGSWQGVRAFLGRQFGRWMLRRAAGIRVVSARIKTALIARGIAAQKITVLPVQVDLAAFLAVGAERTWQDTATVNFLYVGRFAPEKQLRTLLTAFKQVAAAHEEARLTLLGQGPEEAALRAFVTEHQLEQAVTFSTWTNDVPQVMGAHDVLVLTSAHEGYALVLVEAMAAGMSVVTTDVGCVGEVVQDGQHGVVTTTDRESLSNALTAALSTSARERWGKNAYQTAKALQHTSGAYQTEWAASFRV